MKKMTFLDWALFYASMNLYVFPLAPQSKKPISRSYGLLDSTTDPDQITKWWRENPRYNIGMNCGMSNKVVLDIDVKNGKNGMLSAYELFGENLHFFETKSSRTPTGGFHFFYEYAGIDVCNSVGVLGVGLDIRATGGYVVLPPSFVDDPEENVKGSYSWVLVEDGDLHGKTLPCLPFPDILRTNQEAKVTVPVADIIKISEGSRNSELTRIAGAYRRIGMPQNELEAALRIANQTRCVTPLPEKEIVAIAKSVGKYAPNAKASVHSTVSLALPTGGEVMTDEELIASCELEIAWQIEGFVQRSGLLLLSALPKVGKSDLARNMVRSVSCGEEFLGRRTAKGKVLWIGLAEPKQKLRSSIETMDLAGRGIIWVANRPAGPWQPWLAGVIEKHRPDFAVIDEIGRLATDLESINDYSQVVRATQPFLDLRSKYGTTFVLIHHNNKLGGTAGSTAWEGAVDCVMSLTRTQDNMRTIQTKQRLGDDLEATVLERDPNTGIITCTIPKTLADQRHAESGILEALIPGRQMTRQELADLGSRGSYVGRCAVDALLAAGLIEATGTGRRGDPRRYQRSAMFPPENTSVSSGGSGNPDIALSIPEEYPKNTRGKPEETRATRGDPSHPKKPEVPEETKLGLNGALSHEEFRHRAYHEHPREGELPY
jgi:hypothetical protein